MARKTTTVTIAAAGRDQGKVFFLREMPASQVERWAARALMAMVRSGAQISDEVANGGLAAFAAMGLRAFGSMPFEDAEPLLNEMFQCVQIIPDPNRPAVIRPLVESDIEEVETRLTLRMEVFKLHVDFSSAAGRLTSAMRPAAAEGRS